MVTELKFARKGFVDNFTQKQQHGSFHSIMSNVGNILESFLSGYWASPAYLTQIFTVQNCICSSGSYPQGKKCRNVGSVLTHRALAVKVEWRATSKLVIQPFLAIIKVSVLTIFS